MKNKIFTSESVTEGHPDKVCDQISDAILDAILKEDDNARVACETLATTGLVLISGEISTNTYVDFTSIVRDTIREIGYDRAKIGFDADTCSVLSAIKEQSPDIAMGVNRYKEGNVDEFDSFGAGDQGMMFGYATDETKSLMPMPIDLAHKLARQLAKVRKENVLEYLRPDGKTQISIEYENDKPKRIENVVVSTQHRADVPIEQLREEVKREVIDKIIPQNMVDKDTKYWINPTGRFVMGGPMADTGLTGRKIIVDSYGGFSRHGGGAFSGKDPTKVDRSASYYARYIAKNIVAAGLAKKCELGLAYAIGVTRPISIYVNTFGTGLLKDEDLANIINENFDARPGAIIKNLKLFRPIYKQVASYGHFGRDDLDLPWEKTDKVEKLKTYLK
ncbi:methionine adenosyltransferase [Peptoniphilus catoniae]|uniref:methionine adenosyltransferase n=1 Tax=Peptoniphilus catoniae TaxID=1660341 RepID=UPI0010FCE7BE|nr:methionine adenosyltransferase [Peptoniphilus catoniae]